MKKANTTSVPVSKQWTRPILQKVTAIRWVTARPPPRQSRRLAHVPEPSYGLHPPGF